ncbi:class I SAM-dependent methyltransferase [Candidatus Woesearchaeota archaeon]|nr:class I SAM-dependent methyltransferase [Candidatus Woesearchaeota archaeon]
MERKEKTWNAKEEWKQFWNEFAISSYDNICLLKEYNKLLDKISLMVGSGKRVLDAGCGTGNLAARLAKNNKVTAVDFSREMLRVAKEKTRKLPQVEVMEGDVTSLESEGSAFNVVVSVNVLLNLDNPEKSIRESYRVLKEKGALIVSCPVSGVKLSKELADKAYSDTYKLNENREKITELLRFNRLLFKNGGIKFKPTEQEITDLIKKEGFKIVSAEKIYYGSNVLIHAVKT